MILSLLLQIQQQDNVKGKSGDDLDQALVKELEGHKEKLGARQTQIRFELSRWRRKTPKRSRAMVSRRAGARAMSRKPNRSRSPRRRHQGQEQGRDRYRDAQLSFIGVCLCRCQATFLEQG